MLIKGRLIYLLALVCWVGGIWAVLNLGKNWQEVPPVGNTATTTQEEWQVFFATYILPTMPDADAFTTPIRPPDGEGATVTLPFLQEGHLGEDWATAPGDASKGEPVFSVGDGWVSAAQNFNVWGKAVMICYRMPAGRWPPVMEVMYSELGSIDVQPGVLVKKGQKIGTIGTVVSGSTPLYLAHLHWEVRQSIDLGPGGGFSDRHDGWLNPTEQLQAHRGDRAKFPLLQKVLKQSEQTGWGTDL